MRYILPTLLIGMSIPLLFALVTGIVTHRLLMRMYARDYQDKEEDFKDHALDIHLNILENECCKSPQGDKVSNCHQ